MKADQNPDCPDQAGVMLLPWVSLFPGALLPLRIFEERYRKMLSHTLAGHRMFAIAHTSEEDDQWDSLGTLGLVRACVRNDDGTSDLVLQGVSRVKFKEIHLLPHPRGSFEVLRDPPGTSRKIESLRSEISTTLQSQAVQILGIPEGFVQQLATITQPGAFTDMIASTVIEEAETRRILLEELDVFSRMDLLHEYLASIQGN